MKLLTKPSANFKIEKSLKLGFAITGIHLLPDNDICKFKSNDCFRLCLVSAGRGIFNNVRKARQVKTEYFKNDTQGFMLQLIKEINSFIKYSEKRDLIPVIRLNLTSDIDYSSIYSENHFDIIFNEFPKVQFYDYTKDFKKMLQQIQRPYKNYDLTFSFNGYNWKHCQAVLKTGYNVAMVFAGSRLPDTYKGKFNQSYKVINGDESDLRFKDEKGVIVGLLAKGKAKQENSAFVIEP